MTTQNIFRNVAYRLPAILKQRLKLIPFTHVNFSPEFNILCEREFGSSKKKNFQSLPSLVPKKKIPTFLIQIFVALKPPTKFFLRLALFSYRLAQCI